jgi:hypothetical protein
MVPASYHGFFSGCTSVAGALIGLLFVAISVSPHKLTGERASAAFRMSAGLAFSTLTNTLVVALVALLPGRNLGVAGAIASTLGLSAVVGLILISSRDEETRGRPSNFVRLLLLGVLYALQMVISVRILSAPFHSGPVGDEALLAILFFLVAIDRSWELVGGQRLGLLSLLFRPAGGTAPVMTPHGPATEDPDDTTTGSLAEAPSVSHAA